MKTAFSFASTLTFHYLCSHIKHKKRIGMIIHVILLLVGLVLILSGANFLTDGAAALAKRFNISSLVIGLTIVAFGTSAPELTVSVVSAINGSAELAIGNVVGSNIFNILMIVGVTAVVAPIRITRGTLTKEIPLAILSSVVVLICANDLFLGTGTENVINRADGLLMLCFFLIFLGYTFAIAHNHSDEESAEIKSLPVWRCVVYIIGGLAALIFGGRLFVDGSSEIARSLGVGESIIGLTLVAMGTSLPELATSVVAALKKNPEIAIGNVIGSNLFNVFFVLGASAAISPLPLGGITNFDLLYLLGASVLMFFVGKYHKERMITRAEGIVMILAYVIYTGYLIYQL